MVKRKKKSSSGKRKVKGFWYYFVRVFRIIGVGLLYFFKFFLIGVKWLILGLFWSVKGIFVRPNFSSSGKKRSFRGIVGRKPKVPSSNFSLVETFSGKYDSFWRKLNSSDSLIGIILGARGSGKTATALSILEDIKNSDRNFYAMGFPGAKLPKWIGVVDGIEDIKNDSYVVIDEGGILFGSRDSMSDANKMLSDLLFIARHKNLSIFFISQNSSNLEINTLRQADFLFLKKSSLLQKNFERKIVSDIYTGYQDGFDKYKSKKGVGLIYSDEFVGFVENRLPSFWSSGVSKSFK
ncbi:hypothetical protein K9L97_05235 [Candidatus Woesearchaeota archaeon]|nr:hypothetical protein [Candidatus Woesearchaeota archaeon]